MKHKAIPDLAQLSDREFLREIATGLTLLHKNANEIQQSATLLFQANNHVASQILQLVANEEAAKYFILLDAARCPLGSPKRGAQLRKFNDHLAKGIYAKALDWRPDKFGALRRYVSTELDEFYLDGPSDVDWIFKNQILSEREESSYVDYVEMDNRHLWQAPADRLPMAAIMGTHNLPYVFCVMNACQTGGLAAESAVRAFADAWRPVEIDDETHYQTFKEINVEFWKRLWGSEPPPELTNEEVGLLFSEFPFPMHDIEMRLNRVPRSDLEEIQRNWTPD